MLSSRKPDLPATIFDLAGVPRDEEGAFPITQGESLLPLLTGGAGARVAGRAVYRELCVQRMARPTDTTA